METIGSVLCKGMSHAAVWILKDAKHVSLVPFEKLSPRKALEVRSRRSLEKLSASLQCSWSKSLNNKK